VVRPGIKEGLDVTVFGDVADVVDE